MGTKKHSRASKKRWAGVSKAERTIRMSGVAQKGWDQLDEKARRRRAKKGRRTRLKNLEEVINV